MTTAHETMEKILRKMESLDRATWSLAHRVERLADRIVPVVGEAQRLQGQTVPSWQAPAHPTDMLKMMSKMDDRLWAVGLIMNKVEANVNEIANQDFLASDLRRWVRDGNERD